MAKLPLKHLLDANSDINFPRPHLGGSVIGHSCDRYILYHFRWAFKEELEPKLNRIFRIGDAIEEILIKELDKLGLEVKNNQGQVTGYRGHAGGSIDGEMEYESETYLTEFKSMNQNNFLELKRKGVEQAKPQHYKQMTIYMGKRGLKKAMYFVLNKNNSELYIEVIEFDEIMYEILLAKEEMIIDAVHVNMAPKISQNPAWFQCKFCDASDVCHKGLMPEMNCRTCDYSIVGDNGVWHCARYDTILSDEDQRNGCDKWKLAELFSNAD